MVVLPRVTGHRPHHSVVCRKSLRFSHTESEVSYFEKSITAVFVCLIVCVVILEGFLVATDRRYLGHYISRLILKLGCTAEVDGPLT